MHFFPILQYEVLLIEYYNVSVVSESGTTDLESYDHLGIDPATNNTIPIGHPAVVAGWRQEGLDYFSSVLDEPGVTQQGLNYSASFTNKTYNVTKFTVDGNDQFLELKLLADRQYSVRIRSENVVGFGPWSALRDFYAAVIPTKVQNVEVTHDSDNSIILHWQPPNYNGGQSSTVAILYYQVYGILADGTTSDGPVASLSGTDLHLIQPILSKVENNHLRLDNLGPGAYREYAVTAVNSGYQESEYTKFGTYIGLPPKKMDEVGFKNVTNSSLFVDWTTPLSVLPILEYELSTDPRPSYRYEVNTTTEFNDTTNVTTVTHEKQTVTIPAGKNSTVFYTGLQQFFEITDPAFMVPGNSIRLKVRARNVNGYSPYSEAKQFLIGDWYVNSILAAPTVSIFGTTATSITVQWQDAEGISTDELVEYELTCVSKRDNRLNERIRIRRYGLGMQKFEFTNLIKGHLYELSVASCDVNSLCGTPARIERYSALVPMPPLQPYRVFVNNPASGTRDLCPTSQESPEIFWTMEHADKYCNKAVYTNVSNTELKATSTITLTNSSTNETYDQFVYENVTTVTEVLLQDREMLQTTVVIGWDLNDNRERDGGLPIEKYNVYVSDKSDAEQGVDFQLLGSVEQPFLKGSTSYSGGLFVFQGCTDEDISDAFEAANAENSYSDTKFDANLLTPAAARNRTVTNSSQFSPTGSLGRFYKISAVNLVGESPLSQEELIYCGPIHPQPDPIARSEVEVVQPRSDLKVKLPWTYNDTRDKFQPLPGQKAYETKFDSNFAVPGADLFDQGGTSVNKALPPITKIHMVLYIEETTESLGDRDKLWVNANQQDHYKHEEQYHRRIIDKYSFKSQEHLPFVMSTFTQPYLTELTSFKNAASHFNYKKPYKNFAGFYNHYAENPYQKMVNTFSLWNQKARELMLTGGNFAYQEFDNVTISDTTLSHFTFENLKEGYYYWIKYRVGSNLGWSPFSVPNRFYASKLPTKPMQPFGINASLTSLEIGWAFDDDGSKNLQNEDIFYFNVYIHENPVFPHREFPVRDHYDGENKNPWEPFTRSPGNRYLHDCVANNHSQAQLYFWVAGVNAAGEGPHSDVLRWSCSNIPDQPKPPTMYYYLGASGFEWDLLHPNKTDFITMNWTHSNTYGAKIVGTKLYCFGNQGMSLKVFYTRQYETVEAGFGDGKLERAFFIEGSDVTMVNITSFTPTQQYECSVTTISDVGESIKSFPPTRLEMAGKPLAPPYPPKYVSSRLIPTARLTIEYDPSSIDANGGKIEAVYVYVSIDGVVWDTTYLLQPYIYKLDQVSAPYQHVQECNDARLQGDRARQFLWFKYAGYSSSGLGGLSPALKKRCSSLPAFPQPILAVDRRYNPESERGEMLMSWNMPDLYGAQHVATKIWWDYGAGLPSGYRFLATITDTKQTTFWIRNLIRGQYYRVRYSILSDVGESARSDGFGRLFAGPMLPPGKPTRKNSLFNGVQVEFKYTPDEFYNVGECQPGNWVVYTSQTGIDWNFDSPLATVGWSNAGASMNVIQTPGTYVWVQAKLQPGFLCPDGIEEVFTPVEKFFIGRIPATVGAIRKVSSKETSILFQLIPGNLFDCPLVGFEFRWQKAYLKPGDFGLTIEHYVHVPAANSQYNLTNLEYDVPYRVQYRVISECGTSNRQDDLSAASLFYTGGDIDPPDDAYPDRDRSTDAQITLVWPKWGLSEGHNMYRGTIHQPSYYVYLSADPNHFPDLPTTIIPLKSPEAGDFSTTADPEYSTNCQLPDHGQLAAGNSGAANLDFRNGGAVYLKMQVYDAVTSRVGVMTRVQKFVCTFLPNRPTMSVLETSNSTITVGWTGVDVFNADFVASQLWIDDGLGGTLYNTLNITDPNQHYAQFVNLTNARLYTIRMKTLSTAGASLYASTQGYSCSLPARQPAPYPVPSSVANSLSVGWTIPGYDGDCPLVGWRVIERANVSTTNAQGDSVYEIQDVNIWPASLPITDPFAAGMDAQSRQYGPLTTGFTNGEVREFKIRVFNFGGFVDSPYIFIEIGPTPEQMDPPAIDTPTLSGPTSIFLQWNITEDTMRGVPAKGFAVYRDNGHLNSTKIDYVNLQAVDLNGTLSDGTVPDPACTAQAYDGVCYPELPDWDSRSCVHKPVYDVAHARNCTITGLEPNTYYRFRVAAINRLGRGPVSDDVILKTGSVGNVFNTVPFFSGATSGVQTMFAPGAPQSPLVNDTSASITFSWNQPPQEDGDFIFNYKALLTYIPDTTRPLPDDPQTTTFVYAANGSLQYPLPLSTRSLTVRANDSAEASAFLKPRRSYQFQLIAVSELGDSEPTVASDPGYIVGAPLPASGFRQDTSKGYQGAVVHVMWNPIIDMSYAGAAPFATYTESAPPGWTPPTLRSLQMEQATSKELILDGAVMHYTEEAFAHLPLAGDDDPLGRKRQLLEEDVRRQVSADGKKSSHLEGTMLRTSDEDTDDVLVGERSLDTPTTGAPSTAQKIRRDLLSDEDDEGQQDPARIPAPKANKSKKGKAKKSKSSSSKSGTRRQLSTSDFEQQQDFEDEEMPTTEAPDLLLDEENEWARLLSANDTGDGRPAYCAGEDPINTTNMNCTTTSSTSSTSTTTTLPSVDVYFSSESGGDFFKNTFYEVWAREVFNDGPLYRTSSKGVTGEFVLRYKEPIKVGHTTSIMTNSDNPGALMELKMRTVNNNGASDFTPPILVYSGERCPPVRNLTLLEEDPEFVTVNWQPPEHTGYAPFVLYYEASYTTNSTRISIPAINVGDPTLPLDSQGTLYSMTEGLSEQRANYDLYWDINKADLRAFGSPVMYYTITPVTHVGRGTPTTIQGPVVL
ncbi:unnamed protein product [Amoebophrya sp. A120]|nr:unnamed protein product [Amoebophrya sp. A120]|eukprot:GSA120T00003996001.1